MHEIECKWTGDMAFESLVNGHKLILDANEEFGGKDKGPRPKPLLLVALAGCSGMDVVSILKKMREPLSWFNARIQGEQGEEHPIHYNRIKMIFEFKASDGLNDENVHKAIKLSLERYCGVHAMLEKSAQIDYEVKYL